MNYIKEQIKQYKFDVKEHFKTHNYQWKYKLIICLPIFLTLLFFDIITKQLALHFLIEENVNTTNLTVKFLIGLINFDLVFNKGIAFGANSDNIIETIIGAIFITLISFLLFLYLNNKIILIGLCMIITGGFGNLFDRAWNNNWVVDFLVWKLFQPYSIFNFADIYVVFGVIIIIISFFIEIIKYYLEHNKQIKKKIENAND